MAVKLPSFVVVARYSKSFSITTNLVFTSLNCKRKTKPWFCWFFNYRAWCITAVFFRFCIHTIWFKVVGDGTSCSKINSKHIQVHTGENHDIIFKTNKFVFIKQRPKSFRVFGCFSFHRLSLMQFVHKIRSYYRFNVYQYRGILFLFEKVIRKITKRRLR